MRQRDRILVSKKRVVIAIDGVSGAGKGTLASKLADYYKCEYLPTGNIYRVLAKRCLKFGLGSADEVSSVLEVARSIKDDEFYGKDLHFAEISKMASKLAKNLDVRHEMDSIQRNWIQKRSFSIVEGRDIGTKICPNADVKFYIVADSKVRAKRRYLDLLQYSNDISEADVHNDLLERDKRDMHREHSPLKMPKDAFLIDTTDLSVEEMVAKAINIIEKKLTIH